jgi:hypothetical protein
MRAVIFRLRTSSSSAVTEIRAHGVAGVEVLALAGAHAERPFLHLLVARAVVVPDRVAGYVTAGSSV